MVYWADIIYNQPLDIAIQDADSPFFIDEKYTSSPPGFEANDYPIRKKIIKFIGQLLYRIFLNEDLTLNYKPIDFEVVNDYHNENGEHNPHQSYGYLRTKAFASLLKDFIER